MVECFDYDKDGVITEKDLANMMEKCVELREVKKTKGKETKDKSK